MADDQVDSAELAEQVEVFVGGLVHAAGMGVDRADDREIRGEHVELKDRMVLSTHGPRNEEQFIDRPLVRPEDGAELSRINVAGCGEDHPKGLAGNGLDALRADHLTVGTAFPPPGGRSRPGTG